MILIDTNVIIDARDPASPFHDWAEELLADALSGEGAALNAVVLQNFASVTTIPQ